MIVLVPISPEVPKKNHHGMLLSLLFLLVLGLSFWGFGAVLEQDVTYVDNVLEDANLRIQRGERLTLGTLRELASRPLLAFAPSKGNWDWARLFLANFLHGSLPHLTLNLIALFAGLSICSLFLPMLACGMLFTVTGMAGLLMSMFLTHEISPFIPHLGASAGIFGLMGSFYVFNFRFRTLYFFWFPHKHGTISLPTKTFFFIDVLLLEVLLSAAQMLPNRMDGVDHVAHVIGFLVGAGLALGYRAMVKWPAFIQTREELRFYKSLQKKKGDPLSLDEILLILDINAYNDRLKFELLSGLYQNPSIGPDKLEAVFGYFTPTFIRRHLAGTSLVLMHMLTHKAPLPPAWLRELPYDVILKMARTMMREPQHAPLVHQLMAQYEKWSLSPSPLPRALSSLIDSTSNTPSGLKKVG